MISSSRQQRVAGVGSAWWPCIHKTDTLPALTGLPYRRHDEEMTEISIGRPGHGFSGDVNRVAFSEEFTPHLQEHSGRSLYGAGLRFAKEGAPGRKLRKEVHMCTPIYRLLHLQSKLAGATPNPDSCVSIISASTCEHRTVEAQVFRH